MARSPSQRAVQAADALKRYLRNSMPVRSVRGGSSGASVAPGVAEGDALPAADLADPDARRGGAASAARPTPIPGQGGAGAPLRLPQPDWLYHALVVTGPSADLERFRTAAAGAGTVPWQLDLDRMAEDWFHLLVGAGQLSLAGARVLAGQLQAAVARRHALAVARVGTSRACPFDVHALVPMPDAILCLGPDHPAALAWLWAHWGTTEALRSVLSRQASVARKNPTRDRQEFAVSFWSTDWTPWRALQTIRADWPSLRFDLRPEYGAA